MKKSLATFIIAIMFTQIWAASLWTGVAFGASDTEDTLFWDKYFKEKMEEFRVPGVGLMIIKDGKVYLSRGYGYADFEKQEPVNPEVTLFRLASISKTVISFAILKLHDQGLIDLEEEVLTYLNEGDPLRKKGLSGLKVKHLLNHTEGFPSRDLGSFVTRPEGIPTIHEVLQQDLHSPIVQSGSVIAYGSMGSVLAAHLIETVTGKPYTEYLEERVFIPLHMKSSTFAQVLPQGFMERLATTYLEEDGSFQKTNFLYGVTPPSGGMISTVEDLGNFLITILNEGYFQGEEILHTSTVESMLTPQFRGHPSLPGITFGFFEHFENQKWGLVRDGSGYGVNTRIFLLPDEGMGFVFLQNIRSDALVNDFTSTFIRYYLPEDQGSTKNIRLTNEEGKSLAGTYRMVQYHRNMLKIGDYLGGSLLEITVNEDGTLHLFVTGLGDLSGWGGFGKEAILTQIEPLLFKRDDLEGYVAFKQEGERTYLYSGNGYHSAVITGILAILLLIFLLMIWKEKEAPIIGKVWFAVVTGISLFYIPYMIYWHLFPGFSE